MFKTLDAALVSLNKLDLKSTAGLFLIFTCSFNFFFNSSILNRITGQSQFIFQVTIEIVFQAVKIHIT